VAQALKNGKQVRVVATADSLPFRCQCRLAPAGDVFVMPFFRRRCRMWTLSNCSAG
jgi:hypothetical protein